MATESTPQTERHRKMKNVTLSVAALDRLRELARRKRMPESRVVEGLIFEAQMPADPRADHAYGKRRPKR